MYSSFTKITYILSFLPYLLFFFNILFLKLIYFILFIFGSVLSVAARGLSLVAVSGGYFSLWCAGFSLLWLLLLWSTGSRHAGSRAQAPWHVGSSRTRAWTRVPCIGRWILSHCATREAPSPTSLEQFLRAIRNAGSRAIVLILPQIKLNLQLSHCAFLKTIYLFGCARS